MRSWYRIVQLVAILAVYGPGPGCQDETVGQSWRDSQVGQDAARDAQMSDATAPDATAPDAEVPEDGGPTCSPLTYRLHRCDPGGCPVGMPASLPDNCSFLPGWDGVAVLNQAACFDAWADAACPTAVEPVGGLDVDFTQEMVISVTVTINPWCEVQIVPTRVDDCPDRIVVDYDVSVTPQNCSAVWDTTVLLVVPTTSKPIEANLQNVTGCQPPALCENTVYPGVAFFNTCIDP